MAEPLNSDLWVEQYGDMLYHYTLVRVRNPDAAREEDPTQKEAVLSEEAKSKIKDSLKQSD